jgi:inward rectifier potassium channel
MRWPFQKRDPVDAEFVIKGGRVHPLRDVYDLLLRAPWRVGLFAIVSVFLLINALYGLAYRATGGVAGVRPQSLSDSFFFSVQTFGTLGYGAMYPESLPAHLLVTTEVMIGMFLLALATGFTFSKFSTVRARIQFAEKVVISPFNGVPTLMVRLGNERRSRVIDASIHVMLTRLERTAEGVSFYRMLDLALERNRSPNLARSWTVFHRLTKDSPLFGATPESLAQMEAEVSILVTGLDETSSQTIHAQGKYEHKQLVWGARYADLLTELPDGRLQVDLTQFQVVVETAPTPDFAYPRPRVGIDRDSQEGGKAGS